VNYLVTGNIIEVAVVGVEVMNMHPRKAAARHEDFDSKQNDFELLELYVANS
jgi:hypothetical protein